MIQKRKTRVQIAIVENDQLILLHHIMPKHDRDFWGLPGGGVEENETPEQAAIREAKEETCLDIELADFKYEYEAKNNLFYDKIITFIGYPVGGKAKLGYDPEEGMAAIVKLIDIKWHPLYDDTGLDNIAKKDIQEIRQFLNKKDP